MHILQVTFWLPVHLRVFTIINMLITVITWDTYAKGGRYKNGDIITLLVCQCIYTMSYLFNITAIILSSLFTSIEK